MKETNASTQGNIPPHGLTERSANAPVIYSDRLFNVGLGPAVSRLHFGVEVGENLFDTAAVVVLPTQQMVEAFEFILGKLNKDPATRAQMRQLLDSWRSHFAEPNSER